MKKPNDITVEILKDIRGELKDLRGEVHQTNVRLDETNVRLEDLRAETNKRFDELGTRIVESELRTATALIDLAGTVREMTTFLRNQADLRPRVETCELDIADIKRKIAS